MIAIESKITVSPATNTGTAAGDVSAVQFTRPSDGDRGAVDRGDRSATKELADEVHPVARAAADLEDVVGGPNVEQVDRPLDARRR